MKHIAFSIIALSAGSAFVFPAMAENATQPTAPAWHAYAKQLQQICPDKKLDQLKPADLRDALEKYKDGQPASVQKQMASAETLACKNETAGAACANLADIRFAARGEKLRPLAQSICSNFTALP
ncbi:hypothetical protein [Oryzifoliimicrobium ureilyticus]|uniref:hypothetical protein n=1 Tax=Oryzifoliimicrobium ureilyticus TaxID=3113724 RepID=UPI0030761F8E